MSLSIFKGFALSNYAISNDIVLDSDRDMLDFLIECRANNISRGIPEYYLDDIKEASEAVRRIITISEDQGIGLVTYFEKDFPAKLRGIRSKGKDVSPLLLWYKGDLKVAEMPGVAIIGTREPTKEGIKSGEYLGKKFAEAGINVISGLAYGCDKSGHVGALQAEDGKTTAFWRMVWILYIHRNIQNLLRRLFREEDSLCLSMLSEHEAWQISS